MRFRADRRTGVESQDKERIRVEQVLRERRRDGKTVEEAMRVLVETALEGPDLDLQLSPADTLSALKLAIWERSGVPPYHQALVLRGRELGAVGEEVRTLSALGIRPDSRLKLILLTRAGPLFHKPEQTRPETVAASAGTVTVAGRWSSVETEDGEEGESGPSRRREDCARRWEEERRTRARMRKIQEDMERLRLERPKAVIRGTGKPQPQQERAMDKEDHEEVSRRDKNRHLLLSAPEDTSAKESSAGETEYDEWIPRGLGLGLAAPRLVGVGPSEAADQRRRGEKVGAGRGRGCARLASSSSEPESSGAVWTGSEVEESECLWTADEEMVAAAPEVGLEEEYFSGLESQTGPKLVPVSSVQDTPSPSELSSGMLMCEWAHDHRRVKLTRKKVYPAKSTRRAADNPLPPKMGGVSVRPRSKPRQAQLGLPPPPPPLLPSSSKDEGSSEGTSSEAEGRGKKAASKAKRGTGDASTVRLHRAPHSSQSQQRCHACALRLSLPATFQCRCGKAFCARHRHPPAHTCAALDPSSSSSAHTTAPTSVKPSRTHQQKPTQVSD